jgi:predicted Zn-dependent peptidase
MNVLSTPPPVLPVTDWRFPAVDETRLDNGIRVLGYHCPGQYVVSASLLFAVPLNAEPRSREGVAGLTGSCLTKGAAGRSAEVFADDLAGCGADLEAAAFPDGFAVRLAVPATHVEQAFALLREAVTEPAFDSGEFEHQKRLRLQEIDHARGYPQHVAVEQLNAVLFGDARAARPVGGHRATVQAVRRDDVVEYAARHLAPDIATLVVAGDFTDFSPLDLARRSLGDWTRQAGADLTPEQPTPYEGAQLVLVDWPDAPQSTIRMAGPGITRGDPRWPALFVANYAVGGNFSSRINSVLRERKGLTYGATSTLDTGRSTGVLAVSTAVRSDATAEALADLTAILSEARGTLTEREVSTGIRAASDSAALGFERSDAVVGRVEMLVSQGLPLDHVDRNLQRIREVTTDSANATYSEVVTPEAMSVVVVGDARTVRDPLRDWGYASLVERPADPG